RVNRPPARNAPPFPTRARANQLSESGAPRNAAATAPNPMASWLRESSVASTSNAAVGPGGPGRYAPRARPPTTSQPRHFTRDAQRVDVQPAIREPHDREPRIERGPREQRGAERGRQLADGRRLTISRDAAADRESQPRPRRAVDPAGEVHVAPAQPEVPGA